MSTKSKANKRFDYMKEEYTQWEAAYKDLQTYINPTRGRFGDIPNKGKLINHQVLLDSHATQAQRILASGMLSGMTSPSRPWFRLNLSDITLNNLPGVREWLDELQNRMNQVLNKSNIYSSLYNCYEEIGQFGTMCMSVVEDFEDVIRTQNFTCGEYYLAKDSKGHINSFARIENWTVGELVGEFGIENVSPTVKGYFESDKVDEWVKVRHLIEPNDSRIKEKQDFQNMPFRSLYWEEGRDEFLAKRGFKRFPILAARWETVTTDMIYGYSSGWHALGNIKQLQKTVEDKMLAQQKLHSPPMQKDATVEGFINLLPNGISTSTGNIPNVGLRPAYQINPNLESFLEMINSLHEAIDRDFFVNLFLMLMNIDKTNMTATEIAERQQERIMMMGPILHRLQEELLDPLVELVFGIMLDNGLVPEPPEEIGGMELKVQYISILAQAQRAIGVTQIERVVGFAANVVPVDPSIIDNINLDETMREIADMEGTPKKIIRMQEEVDAIREERAKQQQMAQMAEMANSAADTAKKLADAKTGDANVLSGITGT